MSIHFSKVRGWVGAGMADAAGRLVILTVTTAVLARELTPGDFGLSALVLSIVTMFTVVVGAPYEEALAQRRVVRRIHLEAAHAASLVSALAFILIAIAVGWGMDRAYGQPRLVVLMPVTSLLLLAQGPLSIATAVARRRRKFYAINIAGLAGHAFGALLAIGLGLAGAGIWALIGLRVGIAFANAIVLVALLRLRLTPRWCWRTINELNRFAKFILLTRLVENGTLLVYNVIVGSVFGITVLGYANMAMRLIEPVRGAIVAITHNLCVSFFVPLANNPPRLAEETRRISDESTVWIAPVFMGLAAVAPLVVPLFAGPGWDEAVPIAVMLALGGMVALPSQVVISTMSAIGRPGQAVLANVVGLAAMGLVLLATAGRDPTFVGAARAFGDLTQTLVSIVGSGSLIMLAWRRLLGELARTWAAACAMAILVAALAHQLVQAAPAIVVLPLAVAVGVIIYATLLFLFARPSFDRLVPHLMPRRKAGLIQHVAE